MCSTSFIHLFLGGGVYILNLLNLKYFSINIMSFERQLVELAFNHWKKVLKSCMHTHFMAPIISHETSSCGFCSILRMTKALRNGVYSMQKFSCDLLSKNRVVLHLLEWIHVETICHTRSITEEYSQTGLKQKAKIQHFIPEKNTK